MQPVIRLLVQASCAAGALWLSACSQQESVEQSAPATAPAAVATVDAALQQMATAAEAVITPEFLREQTVELSDDRYGGRAPGSEGDTLARQYLAAALAANGFAPGAADGSYEQRFSLVGLRTDAPATWRALAYDCVLNGTELGGGSIRTSDPAVQARMFALLGIGDTAEQERRFGFLLEGLRAGAPPHGGIAFGFDRIAMLLAGASSLRDVIAFPKTTAARALFEGAPSAVPAADLTELHIRTVDA